MPNSIAATISQKTFQKAIYSQERLKPAVDALSRVDAKSLDIFGDGHELTNNVTDCLSLLQDALDIADSIIFFGQKQHEERDQAMISAASSRFFAIGNDIILAKAKQVALIQTHQAKVNELTKKQFTPEEIEKIVINPVEEVEALGAAIEALGAEKLAIQRYLADAPRFDEALLTHTKVLELRDAQQALRTMVIHK